MNTTHKSPSPQTPSLSRTMYDKQVKQALITLWYAANQVCSKRLVPFLPELVEALERHGHLSLPEAVRERLLAISPATVDRLLQSERHRIHRPPLCQASCHPLKSKNKGVKYHIARLIGACYSFAHAKAPTN